MIPKDVLSDSFLHIVLNNFQICTINMSHLKSLNNSEEHMPKILVSCSMGTEQAEPKERESNHTLWQIDYDSNS